jgi:hypothetical protein
VGSGSEAGSSFVDSFGKFVIPFDAMAGAEGPAVVVSPACDAVSELLVFTSLRNRPLTAVHVFFNVFVDISSGYTKHKPSHALVLRMVNIYAQCAGSISKQDSSSDFYIKMREE